MEGGSISGNKVKSGGGGVSVIDGTFTMVGGKIINNNANSLRGSFGGGVFIGNGIFAMNGGDISGNSITSTSLTESAGGGVYLNRGTFTMTDGRIFGNISGSYMSEVSGDPSRAYGGGVYINGSVFYKFGGIILGYQENNNDSNVVKTSSGGVQLQNHGHAIHVNHSNSVYIMGKDITSGLNNNLSFNGTLNPPAWTGDWDY